MTERPEAPARPAATILLLRDRPRGIEVLMVVRHHEIEFASGALVFPGGRVEPGDQTIAEALGGDVVATAVGVPAVRESFEECGILLARRPGEAAPVGADVLRGFAQHRVALCRGEVDFATLLREADLVPALDLLVYFAHWITPRSRPKRFDTHFFLAIAPEDQLAAHDGREAVDSVWIRPQDAVAGAAAGTRKLVFPTRMNLGKPAMSSTAAAAIEAARATPVVTVEPELVRNAEGGRTLRIPAAAGYGGELFVAIEPPA